MHSRASFVFANFQKPLKDWGQPLGGSTLPILSSIPANVPIGSTWSGETVQMQRVWQYGWPGTTGHFVERVLWPTDGWAAPDGC
jgi:hypothetical protein